MNKEELREKMLALNTPTTEKKQPFWEYWRRELYEHVMNEEDPDNFASWPCVYHTLLQRHLDGAIHIEYEILQADQTRDWLQHAQMSPVCVTSDYLEGTNLSMSFIRQLFHLYQYEKWSGERVDQLRSIVEFGAGYGAMALMCYRLGFRGQYYIEDIPEFQLLQQYYLDAVCPKEVEWPIFRWLNHAEAFAHPDLYIACYSISEVDYGTREQRLKLSPAGSYLLVYNHQFADYDNIEYFANFRRGSRPRIHWTHFKSEHMPDHHEYSIGWSSRK